MIVLLNQLPVIYNYCIIFESSRTPNIEVGGIVMALTNVVPRKKRGALHVTKTVASS